MTYEDPQNKKQKTGGSGTQEREENITGSVGVQNRQGQNIHQGSTTSPKGGAGYGEQQQGGGQRQGQGQGQGQGQRQGVGQGQGQGGGKMQGQGERPSGQNVGEQNRQPGIKRDVEDESNE